MPLDNATPRTATAGGPAEPSAPLHADGPRAAPPEARRSIALDASEALRLMSTVSLGRLVFTRRALPTVRPVSHLLDDGHIVIRTPDAAALLTRGLPDGGHGVVVAYEAGAIDPGTHLGWSVSVTGYALPVEDAADLERYRTLLRPLGSPHSDRLVRIRPELVTGVLLVRQDGGAD
ncbi:pyridoxamine 5'-phosphate oxidase family protein [Streptomyces abyssomicinicus]|uniref:pyridoxamine 5'-phosphate oxidase family protein n=1 Tax=Streptomyces abyssomicinicus TaxID=574929 RepID=UPI001250CBB3|nr:pyridoxamine 5'-phosphate oxidase family protein [Streptomyces abyssomicinicus]